MAYHFSKVFDAFDLETVDYWRCAGCGFCVSRTHAEMSAERWTRLNRDYHALHQGTDACSDDPNWLLRLRHQTDVLDDAVALGLLEPGRRWLDFACGDGKLCRYLAERGHRLLRYDRYMSRDGNDVDERDLAPRTYGFVITTSVFEHLTRREDFDGIERLVAPDGVLGLHTLVREEIPPDPAWFYLLPVHCAFHTNESMRVMFRQWGYAASVYNVDARLWLWFKKPPEDLAQRIDRANQRLLGPRYIYSAGFVDYWK